MSGIKTISNQEALNLSDAVEAALNLRHYCCRFAEVGEIRRCEKYITTIEFLVRPLKPRRKSFEKNLAAMGGKAINDITWLLTCRDIPVMIHFATGANFIARQLITTGPSKYYLALAKAAIASGCSLDNNGFREGDNLLNPVDEADILERIGLPFLPPQQRANYVENQKGK